MEIDQISGFVTCKYDSAWWFVYILNVDADNAEVEVTFLHPYGSALSHKYPCIPDTLTIPVTEILSKVSPRTAKGHVYTIIQRESGEELKSLIKLKFLFCCNIKYYFDCTCITVIIMI